MALFAAGWSVLWLFAAQTTQGSLLDWVARERGRGRNWSCIDHRLEGFPFRIEVTCDEPSFRGTFGGATIAGRLGALSAVAEVYAPTSVVVSVKGPLRIESSDRRSLDAAWGSLVIDLGFAVDGLDHARLVADRLQLHAVAPRFDDLSLTARRAETDFAADRGQPADPSAYDFSLRIDKGRLAALDRLFGDTDPATIRAHGIISRVNAASRGDLARAIDSWRRAGGAIEFTEARLRKGTTAIAMKGHLALDAQHRPQGRLDVSGVGLAPVLARYGVPRAAIAIGSLLTGLLGKPVGPAAGAPRTPRLPLRLKNGRVFAGPIRTPLTLPPLY